MGAMIRPGLLLPFTASLLLGACATQEPVAGPAYAPGGTEFYPASGAMASAMIPAAPNSVRMAGPSSLRTSAPSIRAESYILIDPASGSVLAARNADTPHS